MLRKIVTVGAAMALLGAGSVGMAYASTPAHAVKAETPCRPSGGLVGDLIGAVGGVGGTCVPDPLHHGHPGLPGGHYGGGYGGGFYGGGFPGGYGGTYWRDPRRRRAPLQPGGYLVWLLGRPVSYGYQLVPAPQYIEVPVGAVSAGDGSCATLLNRGFSYSAAPAGALALLIR